MDSEMGNWLLCFIIEAFFIAVLYQYRYYPFGRWHKAQGADKNRPMPNIINSVDNPIKT